MQASGAQDQYREWTIRNTGRGRKNKALYFSTGKEICGLDLT